MGTMLMMANHMETLFRVHDVPGVHLEIKEPSCLVMMANHMEAI